MAMGTRRQRERQEQPWYRRDLAEAPGHPFYRRLNEVERKQVSMSFAENMGLHDWFRYSSHGAQIIEAASLESRT